MRPIDRAASPPQLMRIVPMPSEWVMAAFAGLDSRTVNVMFARLDVLPTIITEIVLVSSPGAKVRLPFADMKSLPATAVPGNVAQLTVTVCDDGADNVTVNVIGVHGLQPVAAGATLLFAIDRPGVPDDTVRATAVPGGTMAPAAGD
jgi:hypothetical protein